MSFPGKGHPKTVSMNCIFCKLQNKHSGTVVTWWGSYEITKSRHVIAHGYSFLNYVHAFVGLTCKIPSVSRTLYKNRVIMNLI